MNVSNIYLVSLLGLLPIAVWLYAQWDAWRKSSRPKLLFANTDFNTAVLSRCPSLQAVYHSCKFLTLGQGHVETILRAKLAPSPGVSYKREILLLECGGAVALDWEQGEDDGVVGLPHDAPIFLILPGLTSGSTEPYIQQAVAAARRAGMRAVVFNSRGTSDSPVLTPQFYSASYTEDMRQVVSHALQRYPQCLLFAAGWSLGGNILINYLAEEGEAVAIAAALSLGNPFDLVVSNHHIKKGFNRIYNASLTASMRRIVAKHSAVWRNWCGPAGAALPDAIKQVKSIRQFDEAITVHSFGWSDVDAYYAGSSSSSRIPGVTIPLLCIQAADDPIAPAAAIPYTALAANPNCVLVVTPTGGHLGWAAAPGGLFGEPWTSRPMFEWLRSVEIELIKKKHAAGTATRSNGRSSSSSSNSSSDRSRLVEGTSDDAMPAAVSPGVATPSPRSEAAAAGSTEQQQQQQQLLSPSRGAADVGQRGRVNEPEKKQQQQQQQQPQQPQQQHKLEKNRLQICAHAACAAVSPFSCAQQPAAAAAAAAAEAVLAAQQRQQQLLLSTANAATAGGAPCSSSSSSKAAISRLAAPPPTSLSSSRSSAESSSRSSSESPAGQSGTARSGSLVAAAVQQYQQRLLSNRAAAEDLLGDAAAGNAVECCQQQQQQQQQGAGIALHVTEALRWAF